MHGGQRRRRPPWKSRATQRKGFQGEYAHVKGGELKFDGGRERGDLKYRRSGSVKGDYIIKKSINGEDCDSKDEHKRLAAKGKGFTILQWGDAYDEGKLDSTKNEGVIYHERDCEP